MSIKEKPLIIAVERLGPLPGFLFSNPIFTGIFALMMCAVFGAVFMLFQTAGYGGVEALILFDAARIGAIGGLIVGAIVLITIAFSAFREPDEKTYRLQFVLGGALGIVALVVVDWLTLDTLRAYFTEAGPLV